MTTLVRNEPKSHPVAATPAVSVIIPVFNASGHLRDSLTALAASQLNFELIVVDDGSTDGSAEIARSFGAKVLLVDENRGPAFARNLGASEAESELLLFMDADVCVQADTLKRVVAAFDADPQLDALFGSYDDDPGKRDFLSQYRNLMHHFVHQSSQREARTFWSGFGAITRKVFIKHDGFDTSFSRPAIEDIELGQRLYPSGCKVILDPTIQVKHLKEWSFFGMLTTDVRDRGIPWTELMLRRSEMPNDLNVSFGQRVSVGLSFVVVSLAVGSCVIAPQTFLTPLLALAFLLLAPWEVELMSGGRRKGAIATVALVTALAISAYCFAQPVAFGVATAAFLLLLLRRYAYSHDLRSKRSVAGFAGVFLSVGIVFVSTLPGSNLFHLGFIAGVALLVLLNARFYRLLASRRGKIFVIAAVPLHVLYFLYSGVAFAIGLFRFLVHRVRGKNADPVSQQAA